MKTESSHVISMLKANINNTNLSNTGFRLFVESLLEDVEEKCSKCDEKNKKMTNMKLAVNEIRNLSEHLLKTPI